MRRLRMMVKTKFHIDVWQFFWHMISFAMLAVSAILLEVNSRHAWQNEKSYYRFYAAFIVTLFLSQMPFVYILNRLVSQSLR